MMAHATRQLVVVDASVVVAALTGAAAHGLWAPRQLANAHLAALQLLHFEVANVLRRNQLNGNLGTDVTTLTHADLVDLRIELNRHEIVADRIWELRATLTSNDASYVAPAERIGAPQATLDARLTRASGPMCRFLTPPC